MTYIPVSEFKQYITAKKARRQYGFKSENTFHEARRVGRLKDVQALGGRRVLYNTVEIEQAIKEGKLRPTNSKPKKAEPSAPSQRKYSKKFTASHPQFHAIVDALLTSDMSEAEIAAQCGVTVGNVRYIVAVLRKLGRDPRPRAKGTIREELQKILAERETPRMSAIG